MPPQAPATLGVEFSGTIVALGPSTPDGKHKWQKGDAVFGLAYGGAYAEYIAVSSSMILHKPAELSWAVCAGTPEVWFTALQALYLVGEFDARTHKAILWHAGASAVSIAGIQLSLAASTPAPEVYATARQDSKCAFVKRELGATGAVNATANGGRWAEAVRDLNDGNGMDLVVDFVGASYFAENLEVCARDGRVVTLGSMGGSKLPAGAEVDLAAFVGKRVRYQGSTLRSRDAEYQGRLRDLFEEKALPGLKAGTFETHVERVLDWSRIVEAHQLMESNETKGKIICTIDGEDEE